jgi:hypothetical protein
LCLFAPSFPLLSSALHHSPTSSLLPSLLPS